MLPVYYDPLDSASAVGSAICIRKIKFWKGGLLLFLNNLYISDFGALSG